MPEIMWSSPRLELRELLGERHADLGDLYEQAIDALSRAPLTRPRLMVTGHCIREMCSALPEVLGYSMAGRSDVNRPAKELYLAWTDVFDLTSEEHEGDGDSLRPVPLTVYRAARAVAAAAAEATRNSRNLTSVLATGQPHEDSAPVERLHRAIEFFRHWTHRTDYSEPLRALPAVGRVSTELVVIEEALLTRLGNIADRARALREILAGTRRGVPEVRDD
jgi:hypothetical protein